jgi:hypothetical protein
LVSSSKPPKILDYYVLIYAPHHERAVGDGYVPEQILVAEKSLDRKLTRDEEVRHINGQPHDNRPANLEIISLNADYRTSVVDPDADFVPRRAQAKTFIPCKFQKPCWKNIRGPLAKREGVYLPYVCSFQTEGDIYKCSRFWNFVEQTLEQEKNDE